jgi:hypothetical protein
MRNDCSGSEDQSLAEFRARKVLGFGFSLKRLGRPGPAPSDRCARPRDFEGDIPSMLHHPMIPTGLSPRLLWHYVQWQGRAIGLTT